MIDLTNPSATAELIFDQLWSEYNEGHIDTSMELEGMKIQLIEDVVYENTSTIEEEDQAFSILFEKVDELIVSSKDLCDLPFDSEIDDPDVDLNYDDYIR